MDGTIVQGTILGGESRSEASGNVQNPIQVPYISVVTDTGIRAVNLTKITGVELLDKSLNAELQKVIDEQTEPWGIKVSVVEVKNVDLPEEMQRAIAKQADGLVEARVHPVLIPAGSFLANVDGVYNAILVQGDLVGNVIFFGEGAGAKPTASAVVSDIVDVARKIATGNRSTYRWKLDPGKKIRPIAEIETRYYIRLTVNDRPNVLAQISKVFGDNLISIASVIQKETNDTAQTAEIVIMTHSAREKAMQQALGELSRLSVVSEISNFIRVEDVQS